MRERFGMRGLPGQASRSGYDTTIVPCIVGWMLQW